MSCKGSDSFVIKDSQKMPPDGVPAGKMSLVQCINYIPYDHEPLSCKTYGTNLKCCDWHVETLDEDLKLICWQNWCFRETETCWFYDHQKCDTYPL